MNPTRIENRHGGGIPDVELQWPTGSAFVELKAPRSIPRLSSENLKIRPHLFSFSETAWTEAMSDALTSQKLMGSITDIDFTATVQSAFLASKSQKAWHARRYSNGGLSFFLQKAHGSSFYRLFSPYLDQESGSLRLGLVCETRDVGLVWYALRACAEMHSLVALRPFVSRETFRNPEPCGPTFQVS